MGAARRTTEATGAELIETLTNQAREMVAVATEAPSTTRERWADAAYELLVEVATHYHSWDGCGDGDDFFTKKGSRTARPTASEVPVVTSLRGAHVSCPTGRRRLTSRRTR
jgi:hypothetical protein